MTKTRMIGVACVCAQLFALHAGAVNEMKARTLDARGSEAVWAKEYALSISYYQAAIERYPHEAVRERAGTRINMANSYFRLKQYQKAIDNYEIGKLLFETLPNSQDKNTNLKHIAQVMNWCKQAIKKGVKPEPTLKDVVANLRKLKKALKNHGIVLDDDEKMKEEK